MGWSQKTLERLCALLPKTKTKEKKQIDICLLISPNIAFQVMSIPFLTHRNWTPRLRLYRYTTWAKSLCPYLGKGPFTYRSDQFVNSRQLSGHNVLLNDQKDVQAFKSPCMYFQSVLWNWVPTKNGQIIAHHNWLQWEFCLILGFAPPCATFPDGAIFICHLAFLSWNERRKKWDIATGFQRQDLNHQSPLQQTHFFSLMPEKLQIKERVSALVHNSCNLLCWSTSSDILTVARKQMTYPLCSALICPTEPVCLLSICRASFCSSHIENVLQTLLFTRKCSFALLTIKVMPLLMIFQGKGKPVS